MHGEGKFTDHTGVGSSGLEGARRVSRSAEAVFWSVGTRPYRWSKEREGKGREGEGMGWDGEGKGEEVNKMHRLI